MPEKNPEVNPESEHKKRDDWERDLKYAEILVRAKENGYDVDKLSPEERKYLVELGYYYFNLVEKNLFRDRRVFKDAIFRASLAFKTIQEFEGLRKLADYLLREDPNNVELPRILIYLEDHEGIRNLLNRYVKFASDIREAQYDLIFQSFERPLYNYIKKFLEENKMTEATGAANPGLDLIAIRELSKKYDVAVPIARGGLKQGAIAHLWGMPIRIVDIGAHGRKKPWGRWVNPVSAEDFKGKRVLLFDKDAVTGATVRKALKMLKKFQPKSIGIYFAHYEATKKEVLPEEIEIFSPKTAPIENAGDAYIEAHERLETLYGRRRKLERQFIEWAEKLKEQFPQLAESIRTFASKQFNIFDSLNPELPGIYQVRERILERASRLYEEYKELLENNLPEIADRFKRILETTSLLPVDYESEIIRARYKEQGQEAARRRNVKNLHYPEDPLAAFQTALKAKREGFDIALIVGPEGFAYEPYFNDFGMPTVAINSPEPGVIRLLKGENLEKLRGKKVLVVEDDVRTGATLRKLLETLDQYKPSQLGLYLGLPRTYQIIENIPQQFTNVYIAQATETASQEFSEYLESKGLKIFKTLRISG